MRSDPYWWRLKDRVKDRAEDRCEFCGRRPIQALHHRTYARYRRERPEDVMGVCRPCHRFIHRLRARIVVDPGSLGARGDRGMGSTDCWMRYLLWTSSRGRSGR